MPQLAEHFKAQHPGPPSTLRPKDQPPASLQSSTARRRSACPAGAPNRPKLAAASGKGINMKPTIVAYDGIAVIVNSRNPIKGLTKKQVEQIFTGDVTDWSAVGGQPGKISVYTRNTSSGTYSDFKELAMKKRDYAPSAQKMAGNEQIAAEVGKNANGVGYVGLAYTKAGGIKVMPIDGALPSVKSVQAKTYLTRGRPSTTRTANQAVWRRSSSTSPSALAKRSLRRSVSSRSLSPELVRIAGSPPRISAGFRLNKNPASFTDGGSVY